jgi:uncharacterized protein YecT (DUF1311 family)
MLRRLALCLTATAFLAPAAQAQAQVSSQIDMIDEFANTICGAIERSGYQKTDKIDAGLEGKLTDLLNEAQANGTLARNVENYTNVLQQHLPEELKSVRECRLKIWNDMHVIFFEDGSSRVELSEGMLLQQVSNVPSGPGLTDKRELAQKLGTSFRQFAVRGDLNPSFDCYKATTTSEKVLCSHGGAARADAVLGLAYREARSKIGQADRTVLRQSQRNWIKFRDDVCVIDADYERLDDATYEAFARCLERETQNRTLQLMSYR